MTSTAALAVLADASSAQAPVRLEVTAACVPEGEEERQMLTRRQRKAQGRQQQSQPDTDAEEQDENEDVGLDDGTDEGGRKRGLPPDARDEDNSVEDSQEGFYSDERAVVRQRLGVHDVAVRYDLEDDLPGEVVRAAAGLLQLVGSRMTTETVCHGPEQIPQLDLDLERVGPARDVAPPGLVLRHDGGIQCPPRSGRWACCAVVHGQTAVMVGSSAAAAGPYFFSQKEMMCRRCPDRRRRCPDAAMRRTLSTTMPFLHVPLLRRFRL